jgi:hypothetical protein
MQICSTVMVEDALSPRPKANDTKLMVRKSACSKSVVLDMAARLAALNARHREFWATHTASQVNDTMFEGSKKSWA